jgi:hypothetical protein
LPSCSGQVSSVFLTGPRSAAKIAEPTPHEQGLPADFPLGISVHTTTIFCSRLRQSAPSHVFPLIGVARICLCFPTSRSLFCLLFFASLLLFSSPILPFVALTAWFSGCLPKSDFVFLALVSMVCMRWGVNLGCSSCFLL